MPTPAEHAWMLAQHIVRPQLAVYALAFGVNIGLNVGLLFAGIDDGKRNP
mgnify:CR=1 FL=1